MMEFFKPVVVLGTLLVLTSAMCWTVVAMLPANPLCGVVVMVVGSLAVVMAVDAI